MQKKEKTYKSAFYTFNLNLKSNKRKGGETFKNIILETEYSRKGVFMRANTVMYFRNVFINTVEGKEVVYGIISRNINVEGLEWKNRETAELVDVNIPDGAVPGLKEVFFAYTPDFHRIIVQAKASFSPKIISEFLSKFFNNFLEIEGEHLDVVVQQDIDSLEVLEKARKISKVFVKLTFTNDDFKKESEELMDKLIRESGFGELELTGKSAGNTKIDLEGDLINGALGLATENGFALVSYTDRAGKKQKLNTLQHPQVSIIEVPDNTSSLIFAIEAIKNLFKSRNEKAD
ncbi:DUF4747 family protein [Algoriphagus aquimarinus]|uniref:DUF4747 family protein n=1 Tax=Algoriphagus aquimarinus TaxID=237018 RepID=A0A1I0Y3Y3_9BACT|nr:DUF4747 family protein [Algoriphagus aquimarinus]SFB07310.1 protein of unknown function [Algoriphagus aquimarinus]